MTARGRGADLDVSDNASRVRELSVTRATANSDNDALRISWPSPGIRRSLLLSLSAGAENARFTASLTARKSRARAR